MLKIGDLLLGRSRWLRPPEKGSGDARVVLVGGHQSASLGWAMANLNPELAVAVIPAAVAARRPGAAERLLSERDRHNAVFVEINLPPLRDGGTAVWLGGHAGVTLVPTVAFSAYHPDLVRIGGAAGAPLRGPMGTAHSALALFGHRAGLSPEETIELFRPEVYERVGYLDGWDACADRLRALGARAGFDLTAPLARWARRGCFMHTPDRMRLHAVADLARGLLDRAGIPHHACNLEDHVSDDPGAGESWPVYPGIATRYGVPGSALFLRPRARWGGGRSSQTLSLRTFVEASFAAYARSPEGALGCPRVAAWRADPDLNTWLQDVAVRCRTVASARAI